jgi:hypothetical protein
VILLQIKLTRSNRLNTYGPEIDVPRTPEAQDHGGNFGPELRSRCGLRQPDGPGLVLEGVVTLRVRRSDLLDHDALQDFQRRHLLFPDFGFHETEAPGALRSSRVHGVAAHRSYNLRLLETCTNMHVASIHEYICHRNGTKTWCYISVFSFFKEACQSVV